MSAIEITAAYTGHWQIIKHPTEERKMWAFGRPGDDGQIGCKHDIFNASGREIKSVNLTYEAYDALDNVAACGATGKTQVETEFTGPIQPEEKLTLQWGTLWYNLDIVKVKVKKVVVHYMDNTTETFCDDEITSMFAENSEYQKVKKAEEDKKKDESLLGKLKGLFKK